jgi:hypothetical protein
MKVFRAIESGEACEQYVATIAALAGGTATSADVVEIRPHLRHCAACRATVRQLHVPAGTRVKLLLPGVLLTPVAGAATAKGPPTPEELDFSGHFAAELPERARGLNLGRLRDELSALLHRTNASDAATGVYIASAQGGGRITTIATIIGFCVSGAGAGALCVATGVVHAPGWILDGSDRAPAPHPSSTARTKPTPRGPAELSASSRATEIVATPTPVPTPRPIETRKPRPMRPAASQDPSQGRKPASHENPPISRAPQGTAAEFGPESGGSTSAASTPATTAPVTGGGEFLP